MHTNRWKFFVSVYIVALGYSAGFVTAVECFTVVTEMKTEFLFQELIYLSGKLIIK